MMYGIKQAAEACAESCTFTISQNTVFVLVRVKYNFSFLPLFELPMKMSILLKLTTEFYTFASQNIDL